MSERAPGDLLERFLHEQRLPARYATLAQRWYIPLADQLAQFRETAGRPLVIGINGCQGSGKSTLASLLKSWFTLRHGLRAIELSIDDFYLPRSHRLELARKVHPLLATRGVPGTHDVPLARATLDALVKGTEPVPIPRFDKARDDRVPAREWKRLAAPLDLVVIEGWCLGTPPQREEELVQPINSLEEREDPEGLWRRWVNRQLATHYPPLHRQIDLWVMLKAPSFDCVHQWRLEQERKLAEKLAGGPRAPRLMDADGLARFIAHYQRLTEHALRALPSRVHFLFELDAARNIRAAARPSESQAGKAQARHRWENGLPLHAKQEAPYAEVDTARHKSDGD